MSVIPSNTLKFIYLFMLTKVREIPNSNQNTANKRFSNEKCDSMENSK